MIAALLIGVLIYTVQQKKKLRSTLAIVVGFLFRITADRWGKIRRIFAY
jgi:hypothetical protein